MPKRKAKAQPDADPEDNKKAKPEKPKDVLNSGFRNAYDNLHSCFGGFHSTQVQHSVMRSYRNERSTQFLTHFSTVVKEWYGTLPRRSEIEVQMALVNDTHLFISSNKTETAETLFEELLGQSVSEHMRDTGEAPPDMKQQLLKMAGKVRDHAAAKQARSSLENPTQHRSHTTATRSHRHAGKFTKVLEGQRDPHVAVSFERQGRDACIKINAEDDDIGETVRGFIAGDPDDKQFAIVTADTEMHAEQKILLALCKAYKQGVQQHRVIFAGTYRPCRGCYESLVLVQRFLLPRIQFGSRPGHFWQSTSCGHLLIKDLLIDAGRISPSDLASGFDAKGRLIGLTETSHRPSLRTKRADTQIDGLHYATDSDSDSD